MKCELCEIAHGERKAAVLYEDEQVVVAIKDTVVTPGQISVFPKQHFTILEMVPEKILEHCAVLSKKVSISIFEGFGSQGTNIVVRNGLGAGQNVPHFSIEIIPRQEGDNLNLQWEAKQLMEDEMESAYVLLKEHAAKPEEKVKSSGKEEAVSGKVVEEEGKENYLLKSLRRLP